MLKKTLIFLILLIVWQNLYSQQINVEELQRKIKALELRNQQLEQRPLNRYRWSQFTVIDGLGAGNVGFILKRRDGTFWFATGTEGVGGSGITIWNGLCFKQITTKDGLPSNRVTTMLETLDSTVWVGTRDKGVAVYNNGNWRYFTEKDGLPHNKIYAIYEDKAGTVWIGTQAGLCAIDGQRVHPRVEQEAFTDETVKAITEGEDGSIWFAWGSNKVARLRNSRWQHWVLSDSDHLFRGKYQYPFVWDTENHLLLGSDKGIWTFQGEQRIQITTKDGLPGNHIFDMKILSDKKMYLATEFYGIGVYDGKNWWKYTTEDGLGDDVTFSICERNDGSILIGTGSGLTIWHPSMWEYITTKEGLSSNGVRKILPRQNGSIWFATTNGISVLDHGKWTYYTEADGVPSPYCNNLIEDSRGRVWVVCTNWNSDTEGVAVFDDQKKRFEFVGHYQMFLLETSDSCIWSGNRKGSKNPLGRYNGREWTVFNKENGLPISSCWGGMELPDGSVWISSRDDGIAVFQNNQWHSINMTHGLCSNKVGPMLLASNGDIWVGSRDAGACVLRDGQWHTYNKENGLTGLFVKDIAETPDGHIWLGLEGGGVNVFDGENFMYLTKKQGLPSDLVWCVQPMDDGTVWIGTKDKGVAIYKPPKTSPPETYILAQEQWLFWTSEKGISDTLQMWTDELSDSSEQMITICKRPFIPVKKSIEPIVNKTGRVRFETFAVTRWHNTPEDYYWYSYQLDDSDWSPFEHRTTIELIDLSNGSHTIKVRAKSPDLKVDPTPVVYTFHVQKPFPILAVLLPILGIIGIYTGGHLIVTAREKKRIQKEKEEAERKRELAEKEKEIARLEKEKIEREEEVIRTQKQYFEALFNSAPEAIVSLDMEQDVVDINPQFENLFGYSLDEIKGRNIDDLIVPGDKLQEAKEITERVLQGDIVRKESVRRRKDGALVHVTIGGAPIVVNGKLIGAYAIYVDITERKLLEEKLKEHAEELEKINSKLRREMIEKEDFLRAVSHDLSAPLRNVAGMTSSLLRKYGHCLDEGARHRLERIQSNVDKEMELIQELLELSRIKTRRGKFETVDLQNLIQSIKEEFEYQLEEKGIELTLNNSLPTIYCEKNRIKQVFQNLIDNAVKYMGDVDSPRIEIGFFEGDGRFTFWVKDNGIGIKRENQQRIFHVFRRGEGSEVAKVEGKGIGLASVKSIVENYDGEIWVESEKGKGSTFYFTLAREIVKTKP